ncbi:MAG: hypothetical protein GY851_35335 [bacterium]|nr:hypothetical protein [bacterium]
MASATIIPITDGVEDIYDTQDRCFREYFVQGEPAARQLPVKGKPFTRPGNWPGTSYRVSNYALKALVRPDTAADRRYRLQVWGNTLVGTVGSSADGQTLKRETVNRNATQDDMVITADMVGAHRATEPELGWFINYDNNSEKSYSTLLHVKNDARGSEQYALDGEFVYNNSQAQYTLIAGGAVDFNGNPARDNGSADVGSAATHDAMPFEDTDNANPLTLKHVDASMQVAYHHVTYWKTSNSNFSVGIPEPFNDGLVRSWGPDSGRKYGPLTAGTPNAEGRWRCFRQELTQDWDSDGTPLIQIDRIFIRAPRILGTVRWYRTRFGDWTAQW